MEEVSKLQQAVALQAVYGAIAPEVKAGGDGLRGEVDRELRDIYERTGAKTYSVSYGGRKLGTYSIVESRPEPARTERVFEIVDERELVEWCMRNAELVSQFARRHGAEFARWMAEEYGELPDGATFRDVEVPASPARYKGGMVRVDPSLAEDARRMLAEGGGLPLLLGE